jgi:hypothetical protein
VDYRKLNDVTRKDCFPLPWIHDTLYRLAGAKRFSILDLGNDYWQVDLHPYNKKTAFSMGQGLWKFTVMPFGLCNAPVKFELLMETVLGGLTYESCLVYLDEVIVICRMFQEQLLNLRKVFQQVEEARLKLNPEKCQLFQKELRYVGHAVSPAGKTTGLEKLEAIQELPNLKNKPEIRSFMGLCTYYRWFISGFDNVVKLLIKLKKEKQVFQWITEVKGTLQTVN